MPSPHFLIRIILSLLALVSAAYFIYQTARYIQINSSPTGTLNADVAVKALISMMTIIAIYAVVCLKIWPNVNIAAAIFAIILIPVITAAIKTSPKQP